MRTVSMDFSYSEFEDVISPQLLNILDDNNAVVSEISFDREAGNVLVVFTLLKSEDVAMSLPGYRRATDLEVYIFELIDEYLVDHMNI